MKIYTKKGDAGKTSLLGGNRVSKYDLRIEAYGTVDELNAHMGLLRAESSHRYQTIITAIQNDLFNIGSQLAATDKAKNQMQLPQIEMSRVERLEKFIDEMNESLPELKAFILAGSTTIDAKYHIARCVCRRAERRVVEMSELENSETSVAPILITYLNRLSDCLFVMARAVTNDAGKQDLEWNPS